MDPDKCRSYRGCGYCIDGQLCPLAHGGGQCLTFVGHGELEYD